MRRAPLTAELTAALTAGLTDVAAAELADLSATSRSSVSGYQIAGQYPRIQLWFPVRATSTG